jgi:phosphoserine aminotransferase
VFMTKQVFTFSGGPAALPKSVLIRARDEMLDWNNTGCSMMEISHRSPEFDELVVNVEQKYRQLFNISDEYNVLFLPGGGQGEFAAIPMNLLRGKKEADYLYTGVWSGLAIEEAKKYCRVNIAMSNESSKFFSLAPFREWHLNPEAAYLYYCPNETITGVQFHKAPKVNVPLVADMTSCFGAVDCDVNEFDLIFAAAQKNLGQAGVTLVIVKKALCDNALSITPNVFDYSKQAKDNSRANTPPTYAIYMLDLMLDWMAAQGGIKVLDKISREKAKALYDYIDNSDGFYENQIDPQYRSVINVSYRLPDAEKTEKFLESAEKQGLVGLKGHKKLGGIRASLYNGMPKEGVDALLQFMDEFRKQHS